MTPRRGLALACGLAVVAIVIGWLIRWGTDDAYITFVYARELVRGHGVTWFGTQIEGYTNFAWVLWSALGLKLDADPLWWAWGASLVALGATIVTTYRIAALRATPLAGLCAAAILATNFTFLAFGTSGLETMLQAALLASAWLELERLRRNAPGIESAAVLSLIAALALWTRLDSAPMLAVLGVVAVHRFAKANASIRTWIALVMPAFVLVGGWFLWKVATYGDILPNTFYVKAGTGSLAHGAWFVWQFLQAYLLWPVLAAIVVLALVRRRMTSALPLSLVAAQVAYVIAVGGDFMEFRFFVPLLPPLACAFADLATTTAPERVPSARLRALALIAVLAAVSWRHAVMFAGAEDFSIDSVHSMATFYGKVKDNDWSQLGTSMRVAVAPFRPTIACDGAGAIPYFSDLPTVDQLGLNDAYVARHGNPAPAGYLRPGHQRFAPLDYLRTKQVTFVIGQPILIERGALVNRKSGRTLTIWLGSVLGPDQTYPGPYEVVALPIDDSRELLMWYLTPDPATTARIAGWDHVRLRSRL